jgi:hypothetical protein
LEPVRCAAPDGTGKGYWYFNAEYSTKDLKF